MERINYTIPLTQVTGFGAPAPISGGVALLVDMPLRRHTP